MYINEQAHTKEELAYIKQLKEFCAQNDLTLDYGGYMKRPGTYKHYNTFQKGANILYDGRVLGRMSFRQGPTKLQLFLVVKEYHVDNDVDDYSAEIKLKSDDETRVKTFEEFTTAILDNVQLVEKFRQMLVKIKKFVEIINI